jgi:endonuclease-8
VPEGDTIHRAAAALHRALAGHDIIRFESVFPALTRVHDDHPLTAMSVEKVQASGKHLLMHFSGGFVLRTHMRMHGSWHIYRPGERWRQNRRDMRVLVATANFEAVGFNIPVAEFIKIDPKHALAKHRVLGKLGPDALGADFNRDEAVRRLRSRPASLIADALLNQQLLAGLGNVFKSEVLFACGINPFVTVAGLDDGQLERLVDTGRQLLLANVSTSPTGLTTYTGSRRTTGRDSPAEQLWVYGRGRLPCRRCGTAIDIKKHGTDARLTYWCPECQKS